MRIVVDTNVLLAAAITHGASSEVVVHCLLNHTVCLSPFILQEVKEKLLVKFQFSRRKVFEFIRFLRRTTQKVNPHQLPAPVCRDADDDNVIAAAVAAKADGILSGDRDLLVLGSFQGIRILTPSEFWKFEKEIEKTKLQMS